jgi:NADH:ubiquinone oxidoreductase subunit 2 (subunit N)
LKKILSYTTLFYTGLFLLIAAPFDEASVQAVLAAMPIFIAALSGVYIGLYGLKINREYVSNTALLNGIASVRPYMAAMMTLCLAVLCAVLPFAGFVGLVPLLTTLAQTERRLGIVFILAMFFIFVPACLRIVHTFYFLPRTQEYDRTDRSVCFGLALVMLVLCVLWLYPNLSAEQTVQLMNMTEQ